MAARIERLAVPALQLGLVVEGVHLADAAVHEELDHTANLGSMVQPAVQLGRRTDRPEIGPGEQPLLAQQIRQGDATQATPQPPEKFRRVWSLVHGANPSLAAVSIHKQELVAIEEEPAKIHETVSPRVSGEVRRARRGWAAG